MKKRSLITKLALSGVALAATAATLATSTYAWYTSNSTVEANQITGSSADLGEASVLIKGNADGATWKQKLTSADITISGNDLKPVTYDNTQDKYVDLKNAAIVGDPAVKKFSLYFKTVSTSNDVKLKISSISIANTTADANTSTPDTIDLPSTENLLTGTQYKGDILDSLALRISNISTETGANLDSASTNASLNKAGYSLAPDSGNVSRSSSDKHDLSDLYISGYTAHTYVNAIMGEGTVTKDKTDVAEINDGDVYFYLEKTGKYTKVDFEIYLDGANEKCFDVLKNQSFSFNITFDVAK